MGLAGWGRNGGGLGNRLSDRDMILGHDKINRLFKKSGVALRYSPFEPPGTTAITRRVNQSACFASFSGLQLALTISLINSPTVAGNREGAFKPEREYISPSSSSRSPLPTSYSATKPVNCESHSNLCSVESFCDGNPRCFAMKRLPFKTLAPDGSNFDS